MSEEYIDQAQHVRPGEELDRPALLRFLSQALGSERGEVRVRQFPSGHSNLTYLVEAGDHQWVLRRPPLGTRPSSGHDMAREYRILAALNEQVDWVPRPVALCEDDDILGAPFYLMQRVRGVILRGDDGGVGELGREQWRRLSSLCIDTLAAIHEVDIEGAELADIGKPPGYVERQIEGWTRRWEQSRTDAIETIEDVADWLNRNQPPENLEQTALIHNDFKYDNLVLDAETLASVRAVLDWELATLGDRRMDLGTTLAYWTEPDDDPTLLAMGLGPTVQPGNFNRRQVVEHYQKVTDRQIDDLLFFYVYGLFKVAVIGQQIYYRFHHGETEDPRFAGLIHAVRALGRQAAAALESDSISNG